MSAVLTVTQLNFFLRSTLEGDPRLADLTVRGEISNYRGPQRSGHLYFSLKDDRSVIPAVMFAQAAARLRFSPEEGMKVLVRGRLTVYEAQGRMQLIVNEIVPEGAGALAVAFEQLKARLEAEGVFENARPLPPFPRRIGVITSADGAAVQDILEITGRRWPLAEIVLAPVLVQGEHAAEQLTAAVGEMNRKQAVDVIIIGRGGGSMEDLWAFNDETLARAVAASAIPVVSAVGHETDFTLCDFAADLRAPTPSAAAEQTTPVREEVLARLLELRERMVLAVHREVDRRRQALDLLVEESPLTQPERLLEGWRARLAGLEERSLQAVSRKLERENKRLALAAGRLDALSPLKVLGRGYAVVQNEAGRVLTDGAALTPGETVHLRFARGRAAARVLEAKGEDHE
mgnify:CR=1 FL=1